MKAMFVKTKNVKGFINLIHNLKNKPDNISKIGLVYGNAGLGKTKTALYLSIQSDAIYVRATNSMSPKWMLEEIAKELDEIFREGALKLTFEERKPLYDRYQTIIYDQKPIIYLYSPIRITAIRKKFKNIYPTALNGLIYNLDEIYVDGDKG